jgi:hypothetical protein
VYLAAHFYQVQAYIGLTFAVFKNKWFLLQIASLIIGIWGGSLLPTPIKSLFSAGVQLFSGSRLYFASWLATLALGLKPDELFDKTFNPLQTERKSIRLVDYSLHYYSTDGWWHFA